MAVPAGQWRTFTASAAETKQVKVEFAAAVVGAPTKHGSPVWAPVMVMAEESVQVMLTEPKSMTALPASERVTLLPAVLTVAFVPVW